MDHWCSLRVQYGYLLDKQQRETNKTTNLKSTFTKKNNMIKKDLRYCYLKFHCMHTLSCYYMEVHISWSILHQFLWKYISVGQFSTSFYVCPNFQMLEFLYVDLNNQNNIINQFYVFGILVHNGFGHQLILLENYGLTPN